MSSVAASSSSPSPPSSSSSSIVVLHVDMSDMRPILKEAFGKNVEIATISNNGSIPAKYFYEGLQNYIEGIVANHGGGGDDDEDAQRTADGVTPNKKNIGIILKEILNDNLRTALTPFDRDGDGTIDAEELQQAAKDHQTVLMSRKILAWFAFALFLFMIIVCGGLSVGIYYIVFSMKDTYVNPSTGLMMVKAPDGSTNTNTAGIGIELPTKTLGQGVTITSQGTMGGGRTCYSSDSVANMFVNVATGVTTSLAETNQDTDELHIYHLGNSDCDESNILWSNKDVQLGCVVMVPSLECTNMVRRGRYLSEFADTDTDAMQDRHRSLKEHVANMIVGATAIGQHGTTIDRSNRNLKDNDIAYANTNALSTGTCTDSKEVLYRTKKYPARKCDYVANLTTGKMKETCKKNTKPNRGKVYDLCQKTCATVGLGPCKAGGIIQTTQQLTLCEKRVADLEAIIASTTSPSTSPTDAPTKRVADLEAILASTSQCNADDGELAFNTCRCSELTVPKDNVCSQVPIDCVGGYERGTGKTCKSACDGQCCTTTSTQSHETPCTFFTGLIHRDGSCTGAHACQSGTVDEVKGPGCTGRAACSGAKISRVTESCNGEYACDKAEVGLMEGSCNGSTRRLCSKIHAASIIDGEVDVCSDECSSAYIAAGEDENRLSPCDSRSNDKEVEIDSNPKDYDPRNRYPTNFCTYLACIDGCREVLFPSSVEASSD